MTGTRPVISISPAQCPCLGPDMAMVVVVDPSHLMTGAVASSTAEAPCPSDLASSSNLVVPALVSIILVIPLLLLLLLLHSVVALHPCSSPNLPTGVASAAAVGVSIATPRPPHPLPQPLALAIMTPSCGSCRSLEVEAAKIPDVRSSRPACAQVSGAAEGIDGARAVKV